MTSQRGGTSAADGRCSLSSAAWRSSVALAFLVFCLTPASLAATTNARPATPTRNVMNKAFVNAGTSAGLEIWRIENFVAVKYPKSEHGKFYSGDSYIVLNTKMTKSGERSWDIHYWLGKDTSQDESGAAAIMSVELDDQLGGGPVQHREVQEHESALFLSYFPTGVRYLNGGVASGFQHVDRTAVEKRLFQVKGKRNVRVRQVELNARAMNKGDCFILDAGPEIYIYTGAKSSRTERLKAISAANQIRDQDHAGRSHVQVLDESANEAEIAKFFQILGSGSAASVASESTGGDDAAFERTLDATVALWKVSDSAGVLKISKVADKPLSQNLLDPDDSFILDTVTSGLYVWIGKKATSAEKIEAMKKAQEFLKTNNYPAWTQIKRVVQGAEPSDFKQYFSSWRAVNDQIGLGRRTRREVIAADMPPKDEENSLWHARRIIQLNKSAGKAYGFMPDNGEGQLEVFRIEDHELAPVNKAAYGMFFGGDSYVIKYTYQKHGFENHILYFWQGKESSIEEKAASEQHVFRLDQELQGNAVQIRVTEGHEPRHFLRLFRGKMIIFSGGRHSGFKHMRDHDTYDQQGVRLFQVRGTSDDDIRATQVPEVAASLNSDDVYILETPTNTYLWVGEGALEEEITMAVNTAKTVSPNETPLMVKEGHEPEDFWAALGGKGPYSREIDTEEYEPRLFHCRIRHDGKFLVEEIEQFQQSDLDEEDIMLLDSGEEIYVWIGSKADEQEKNKSLTMAQHYLKTDPSDRSHERNLIITIKQGAEPDSFVNLFPSWNATYWESLTSYEDLKNELNASIE